MVVLFTLEFAVVAASIMLIGTSFLGVGPLALTQLLYKLLLLLTLEFNETNPV